MVVTFIFTVLELKHCIWTASKMKLRLPEATSTGISSHTARYTISILLFKVSHAESSPNTGIDDNLLAG